MSMLDLLKVTTKVTAPLNADTSGVAQSEQVMQPVFITTATLGTFAGGSVAITVIWKVAIAIFDWNGLWFPGVLAAFLGLFFFWQAMESEKLKGSKIMGAFIVALVNACILWAAAVGLDTGLDKGGVINSAAT